MEGRLKLEVGKLEDSFNSLWEKRWVCSGDGKEVAYKRNISELES